MLELSATAAAQLEEVRRSRDVPSHYGVRVSGASNDDGGLDLRISFARDPNEGDAVTEQHGTRLFVAREIAEPLSRAQIDVAPDVARNGNVPSQLVVRAQPDAAP